MEKQENIPGAVSDLRAQDGHNPSPESKPPPPPLNTESHMHFCRGFSTAEYCKPSTCDACTPQLPKNKRTARSGCSLSDSLGPKQVGPSGCSTRSASSSRRGLPTDSSTVLVTPKTPMDLGAAVLSPLSSRSPPALFSDREARTQRSRPVSWSSLRPAPRRSSMALYAALHLNPFEASYATLNLNPVGVVRRPAPEPC